MTRPNNTRLALRDDGALGFAHAPRAQSRIKRPPKGIRSERETTPIKVLWRGKDFNARPILIEAPGRHGYSVWQEVGLYDSFEEAMDAINSAESAFNRPNYPPPSRRGFWPFR